MKHPTVSNIENKKRPVSKRIKKFLETKFSVNIKWLETGYGEMFLQESKTYKVIDRIGKIIEWTGLSVGKFSDKIGYDNAEYLAELITKGKEPEGEIIDKILETYSQINADWLRYNQGTMFFSKKDEDSGESLKLYKELYEMSKKRIEDLEEENRRLHELLRRKNQ
jgi:hypothetical protein